MKCKKNITLDILTMSFIFGHFVHGPLSSSSQSQSFCLRSHRVCEVPWRNRQSRGGFCPPSPTVCYHGSSSTFQTQVHWGTFCCSSPQMDFFPSVLTQLQMSSPIEIPSAALFLFKLGDVRTRPLPPLSHTSAQNVLYLSTLGVPDSHSAFASKVALKMYRL